MYIDKEEIRIFNSFHSVAQWLNNLLTRIG